MLVRAANQVLGNIAFGRTCGQICRPLKRGVRCECHNGYKVDPSNVTHCIGKPSMGTISVKTKLSTLAYCPELF